MYFYTFLFSFLNWNSFYIFYPHTSSIFILLLCTYSLSFLLFFMLSAEGLNNEKVKGTVQDFFAECKTNTTTKQAKLKQIK